MHRSGPARVVFIDPHHLFADCLGLVLESRGFWCREVPLRGETDTTMRVSSRVVALRPDVALINADAAPGRALVASVAGAGVPVAVLVDFADESRWGGYLIAGARVVLPKSASLQSMLAVVRRMSRGEAVLDPVERERLLVLGHDRESSSRRAQRLLERLSPQEKVVLRHLMGGLTVREIAGERVVSEATVRTQVKAILAKLDVGSQLTAVALAHRAGWRAARAGATRGS